MNVGAVKAYARERMLGHYGKAISAILTVTAVRMIASGIVSTLFGSPGTLMLVFQIIASVILEIIGGIFVAGLAFFFLKVMYGKDTVPADVFHAFSEQPDKAVRIMLVLTVAAQLWEIPVILFLNAPVQSSFSRMMIVCMIAGGVVYLYVWLTYSQAFYLLQDFPDRDAAALLQMSKELMRGNKGRLLALQISFLPLFILGIVTLVLPLLWVGAYMQAAQASFYRELMLRRNTHGMQE